MFFRASMWLQTVKLEPVFKAFGFSKGAMWNKLVRQKRNNVRLPKKPKNQTFGPQLSDSIENLPKSSLAPGVPLQGVLRGATPPGDPWSSGSDSNAFLVEIGESGEAIIKFLSAGSPTPKLEAHRIRWRGFLVKQGLINIRKDLPSPGTKAKRNGFGAS